MISVYLDNDVVSAIARRDRNEPIELQSLDRLLELERAGFISRGTSRQSAREMDRAPPQHQARLKVGLTGLQIATDDHRVLDSFTVSDQYGGFICNPCVTDVIDDALHKALCGAGLKHDDAHHLMYAVHNGFERFLTWDRHFLSRRAELAKLCPSIPIQTPCEFVASFSGGTAN